MAAIGPLKLFVASGFLLAMASLAGACTPTDYAIPRESEAKGGKTSAGVGGFGDSSAGGARGGVPGSAGTGPIASGGAAGSGPIGTAGTAGDPSNCRSDQDCAGQHAARVCDTATALCVECLPGKTSCGAGQYCAADKECHIGCNANAECITGACDVMLHRCTGCNSNAECSIGTLCDATTQICVPGCDDVLACPAGFTCCASTCVNLYLDEGSCGSCGTSCSRSSASVECREAVCVIQGCTVGYSDCNGKALDGCEADLLAQAANCGACGNACTESLVCKAGACASAVCSQGFVDCDSNPANGCETNIERDINNCGSCASACSTAYGTPSCTAGNCAMTCNSGWGDCDLNPNNGCEADLNTNAAHCGRCDVACNNNHGGADCVSGKCTPSCGTGFGDCDGIPANGCESTLLTDNNNCGQCGNYCSLSHATASCTTGRCTVATCAEGWADCNALPADGCEVNLQTDPLHCGSCSNACSTANGTASCSAGQCAITCLANYGNCDNVITNGCEVDLTRTVANCASCGHVCPSTANGTAVCDKSICGISNCTAPYGDCDSNVSNGCESDTSKDVKNCGSCGTVCSLPHATATCSSGVCGIAKCDDGWGNCNGIVNDGCEQDLLSNLTHCGACNAACGPNNAVAACSLGKCGITSCSPGYQDCNKLLSDGCEINTLTSVGNCGACGAACSAVNGTPSCVGGGCNIVCALGYGNCDGTVSTGCETQTSTSASHCGGCNKPCSPKNGTGICQNSNCAIGSCNTNFQDCDATYSTGCEANVTTDTSNCATCKNVCNATNGTASCSVSGCGITCNSGYKDCSSTVAGCETNINDDEANCGGCGNTCGTTCMSGVCGKPCTGLCASPTLITISGSKTYESIGTLDVCYETTSALNGGGCSSFATGRTLEVNGIAMNCTGWDMTKTTRTNGGYCIHASAGDASFAAITVW